MLDSNLIDLNNSQQTITFEYIKGNYFRVIYADGFMANLNSKNDVHLVLWNQRAPIPRQETYSLKSNGELDEEVDSVTKGGMIREIEADIILSKRSAILLKELLEEILSNNNEDETL